MPFLVLSLALFATAPAGAQTAPWRFLHPGAKVVAGINWRVLKTAPGIEALRAAAGAADFSEGMDFIEEIDSVFISSPGPKEPHDHEVPFLLFAEGRFDLAALRRKAREEGARPTAYKLVEIYAPPEGDLHLAVLGPHALLAGDRVSVRTAIDRKDSAVAPSGPLAARAIELSNTMHAWAVFTTPPASVAPNKLAGLPLAGIEELDLGISARAGMAVHVHARARDSETARIVAANVEAMLDLAALRGGGGTAVTELLRSRRVATAGNAVDVALAQVAATASTAPPAVRKVIRIYGLDEGTREIPFGR